jgi:DNA-binding SARP family transcriptional activator
MFSEPEKAVYFSVSLFVWVDFAATLYFTQNFGTFLHGAFAPESTFAYSFLPFKQRFLDYLFSYCLIL